LDYPQLDLDTVYRWQIKPCWDFQAEKCEDFWSDVFYFRTGYPSTLIYPGPDATQVPLPIKFDWQDVPGTKSYRFKIQGNGLDLEKIIEEISEVTLDYPELQQETEYAWQIEICAKSGGRDCGASSEIRKFKTFKLKAPANPKPKDGSTISTTGSQMFSWNKISGVKYYQFQIEYSEVSAEETRKECLEKEGEITTKILSENSIFYPLECNGKYQWQVRGCLVENCESESVGDWSELWTFTLVSKKTEQEVTEEMLIEVLNDFSKETLEGLPEEISKRVSEKVSEKVLELVKNLPEEISTEVINELNTKITKKEITKVSDIPPNLQIIFGEVWDKKSEEILSKAAATPEVPEEVLKEVLEEVKKSVLEKVLERVNKELSGITELPNAINIVQKILQDELRDTPKEISNKTATIVSEKVLEVTKDMPGELLRGMLEKLSEEILKISKLSEVPEMLERIFSETWAEVTEKVLQDSSKKPEIPVQVLRNVLGAMKGEVLDKLLEKASEKIPGVPAKVEIRKGGLIPCGRSSNNPDTPWWDETESCEIKHLFIMLKIIIDFLLFKLAPICLALLAAVSGVIFYFSLKAESATPLAKVKSLWKAAAIGFGILLFSWLLISFIFTLFGYQFGPWWQF